MLRSGRRRQTREEATGRSSRWLRRAGAQADPGRRGCARPIRMTVATDAALPRPRLRDQGVGAGGPRSRGRVDRTVRSQAHPSRPPSACSEHGRRGALATVVACRSCGGRGPGAAPAGRYAAAMIASNSTRSNVRSTSPGPRPDSSAGAGARSTGDDGPGGHEGIPAKVSGTVVDGGALLMADGTSTCWVSRSSSRNGSVRISIA